MPRIGMVNSLKILVLARGNTGSHGNRYIKVVRKSSVVGKYLIDDEEWENKSSLSNAEKSSIEALVKDNKALIDTELEKLEGL